MRESVENLRLFGDPVRIAVRLDAGGNLVELRTILASERCRKFIDSVSVNIAKSKPLAEQLHNVIALGDLLRTLLDLEDAARPQPAAP